VTTVTELPADPALPQLSTLLDRERMEEILARSLRDGTPGPTVEIEYVRYRPGRSLLVLYEAHLGEATHGVFALADARADLAARAEAPEAAVLVAKLASRTPAAAPLSYVQDIAALVHWLPLDLALPALAEPPERLRERLAQAGLDLDADDLPRIVKHKPTSRGVLRLEDHFVKVFPDRRSLERSVRALELSASLPFPTARCTVVAPELVAAGQSRIPGERPKSVSEIAGLAGRLLAMLHATTFPELPVETPAGHLDSVAKQTRLLGTIVPGLAPRLETIAERLEETVPSGELVSSHGGFHISQLLWSNGELAVVDFDGMCRAPAADDIASFVASVVEHPDDLQQAAGALDVFLDAYGHRPPGVTWYLALHLLGRARRPFTRLQPDWPSLVEERVTAVERVLELEG
jgi:hypothetical protein